MLPAHLLNLIRTIAPRKKYRLQHEAENEAEEGSFNVRRGGGSK